MTILYCSTFLFSTWHNDILRGNFIMQLQMQNIEIKISRCILDLKTELLWGFLSMFHFILFLSMNMSIWHYVAFFRWSRAFVQACKKLMSHVFKFALTALSWVLLIGISSQQTGELSCIVIFVNCCWTRLCQLLLEPGSRSCHIGESFFHLQLLWQFLQKNIFATEMFWSLSISVIMHQLVIWCRITVA